MTAEMFTNLVGPDNVAKWNVAPLTLHDGAPVPVERRDYVVVRRDVKKSRMSRGFARRRS